MDSVKMQKPIAELLNRYPALAPCGGSILDAAGILAASFEKGGKLLLCGNGGSAADCGHIAGELLKGFLRKRPVEGDLARRINEALPGAAGRLQRGLPAIDLTAQSAILTASLNDIAGELIFAQQTLAFGRPGDALIGLSTSGNAANVVNAFAVARALGMSTIAMTGRGGGRLAALADCALRVPADSTPDVQELHLPVYHALCAAVEAAFFDR